MAVRELDGTDDLITLGGSGAAWATDRGMIVLLKPATTSGTKTILAPGTGASTDLGGLYHWASTHIAVGWGGGDAHGGVTYNTTNWWLWGWTKLTAAVPRFHMANVTTGAAATHNAGTDDGGGTSNTAGNWTVTKVGNFHAGGGFGDYRVAAAAVYGNDYSDADFDGVAAAKTTASLAALGSPLKVWDFNQAAVGTDVIDLLTGLDDQTAITGTTVIADGVDDPPGWTFGLEVPAEPVGNRMRRWRY